MALVESYCLQLCTVSKKLYQAQFIVQELPFGHFTYLQALLPEVHLYLSA
jgi:hypothetical protein